MDDILVFYMLKKATNLTNYLADVYYCRAHYIRSLMWSQATTKYEFCGILKIEKVIDVTELQWRCNMKADAVEVTELTKTDCRLWNRMILFKFLSFFSHFFSWYFIYFPFMVPT